jgi:F0F1-type ATP synthase beta subunit
MRTDAATAAGEQAAVGVVAAVHGVVIDVDFSPGGLPPISHALVVQRPSSALVVEVHAHLSGTTARCISLAAVTGVRRGLRECLRSRHVSKEEAEP